MVGTENVRYNMHVSSAVFQTQLKMTSVDMGALPVAGSKTDWVPLVLICPGLQNDLLPAAVYSLSRMLNVKSPSSGPIRLNR